jgi:di/tricarboxylate transporter
MGWEAWVTLVTVLVMMYGLAREAAGPDVLLSGAFTFLMTMSVVSDRFLSPTQAAAVFGNEGMLTVGALFIVAAGLTQTGGLNVLTERIMGTPRTVGGAQLRLMLPVATVSSILNNTPVVAMFMPLVSDLAKRANIAPSKLFMPLSYGAVLGGLCTLIGTSTNLVVQGLLQEARRGDPSVPLFEFFTLGVIGLPVAIVGITYIVLVSKWLLPDNRTSPALEQNPREYTIEMLVQPGSPLDGRTIEDAGLRHLPGLYVASVERSGEVIVAVPPMHRLNGHDRLVFVGVVESIVDLQRLRGLVPASDDVHALSTPRHNRHLVEAVVSGTSPLVGQTIRDARFRTRYGAVVIAVHRAGERIEGKIGDIKLRAGDMLLLEAPESFAETYRHSWDFFLVSRVANSQPRNHDKAWVALAILGAFIALAATDVLSEFNAALLAGGVMGLTGCVTAGDARRSIDWSTLIAIAAALGIGRTVESTGLAAAASSTLIPLFRPFGDLGVLAGVYLLVLVFTEILTNNAAAALTFPVAYAVANDMGMNVMPFAVVIAIAASAGFATPLGYQTHLMVYGPGGYRFGDFVRLGVPLDVLAMIVTLALTPFFFPLR